MNKLLAIVLSVMSFVAQAAAADEWTTKMVESGNMAVVLPLTVKATSATEWTGMVELVYNNGQLDSRVRVNVTGCPAKAGRTEWFALSGMQTMTWDWVDGGGRTFDFIAFNICRAAYEKGLFKHPGGYTHPPRKTPAPDAGFIS